MQEKRNFSRIKFEVISQVLYDDKKVDAELMDISLKGALLKIQSPVSLKLEDACQITIHLPSSAVKLKFDSLLVHIDENLFGFKFLQENIDTLTHLRRILELNMGDDHKITDELFFLLR